MSEVVCSCISLNGELKLRNNLLIDGDLESYIADWLRVGEPALDLNDPKTFFLIVSNKLFDLVDRDDDVLNLEKHAFPSDHVTDLEGHLFLFLKKSVDGLLVFIIFIVDCIF